MKMLINQKGSSLVQVMVISGMVSVFGLAVMQTSKNMQSMKQTLMVKDSIEQFKETASNLLMNEQACNNTFSALIANRSQAYADKVVPQIMDYDNSIAYQPYSEGSPAATTYHGNIRIGEMRFIDFDDTTDSIKLQVTVVKSKMDGVGSQFGQLVLGGKEVSFEIPLRVYFAKAVGGAESSGDAFESCFADNAAFDEDELAPLEKLCDNDLGGSYYNGKCIVTEHIMDQARCDGSYKTCSGVPSEPANHNSICHSLGGVFDPNDGSCNPRFGGAGCPAGTKLKGFDAEGNLRCEVP
tara:strand:+ start:2318 stop:3205 length:888 start_codon:yes stop_codon:yes gene_type:complete